MSYKPPTRFSATPDRVEEVASLLRATEESNGPDPLATLHAEFAEAMTGDASSNDVVQLLDDFLTKRGYPTVLYA